MVARGPLGTVLARIRTQHRRGETRSATTDEAAQQRRKRCQRASPACGLIACVELRIPKLRGAPPLDWSELSPAIRPGHFTVDNLPRLRHLGSDPWAENRPL